jgi:aldehyde:ferredoxin oxidoreductase
VTTEEYLSRQERYDNQISDEMKLDPTTMSLAEKMAAHRTWRQGRYEQLTDAVYKRRGWTSNGVPTLDRLKELGLDAFPEVVAVVKQHL